MLSELVSDEEQAEYETFVHRLPQSLAWKVPE
jgi:hypothetical protein